MGKRQALSKIPKSIMAAKVFQPLYKLLSDIDSGEVIEADNVVLTDKIMWDGCKGVRFDAVKTINMWCLHWDTLGRVLNLHPIKDEALRKVAFTLASPELEFMESDLVEAKNELNAMYRIWVKTPTPVIAKALSENINEKLLDDDDDNSCYIQTGEVISKLLDNSVRV